MIKPRIIQCEVCKIEATEERLNGGWIGWGALRGVQCVETGESEISLCPSCLNIASEALREVS